MNFPEELKEAWRATEFNARDLASLLAVRAKRIIFIGNGGSAAIASHMAADFAKNGKVPCMAFNDGASLTCLGNDCGYENVFAIPMEQHATQSDAVIAISSSGQSPNILAAASAAKGKRALLITFTGFEFANPLRAMGHFNIHVPSIDYGVVETIHLGMLHETLRELPDARLSA